MTGHRARLLLLAAGLAAAACERAPDTTDAGIEPRDIAAAERVVGLEFTPAERGLMSAALGEQP